MIQVGQERRDECTRTGGAKRKMKRARPGGRPRRGPQDVGVRPTMAADFRGSRGAAATSRGRSLAAETPTQAGMPVLLLVVGVGRLSFVAQEKARGLGRTDRLKGTRRSLQIEKSGQVVLGA